MQSDRDLVQDVARGSAEALAALYDAHAGLVYGLAKRMLLRQEDAEEVVQDVFAQVWREAARYQADRATLAGWLVMLTRTRAIDRLRSRNARPDSNQASDPVPQLDASVSMSPNPESAAVSSDEARRVRTALQRLPAEHRSLVDLAYFEGLSHSEIAERTGAPLGTVKTRLRAALQTLREAMTR